MPLFNNKRQVVQERKAFESKVCLKDKNPLKQASYDFFGELFHGIKIC
ncbi:hypothetical protein KBC01_01570 [Candidatus Parcubacteria bacterium]|nr:hypothetical protein [Candidatus Parcubacteria bacterium]